MNKVNIEIHSVLSKIRKICKKYNVNKMYVFGSALSDKYKKGESDLDLLIDIDSIHLRNIVRLKGEISSVTGAKIDLFKVGWVKTEEMLNYLKRNKVLIYDKGNAVTNTIYHSIAPTSRRRI